MQTATSLPPNADVWVLAGQSNMQGYGLLEGCLDPDPLVYNFHMAGHWEQASEPLHRPWESFTPVHVDLARTMFGAPADRSAAECAAHENRVRTIGAGLGLSFGIHLASTLKKPVGLIPTAFGGTSLEQWSPAHKDRGGRSLYGAMLERIRIAGGNLRGILWYQGESDCTASDAPTYGTRLEHFIQSIRKDCDKPDLPFLAVQLGRLVTSQYHDHGPLWDMIRETQRLLPERIPKTAITSAIDLGMVDAVHIDTPGLIRLGRRLAELAADFESGNPTPASPRVVSMEKKLAPHGAAILRLHCAGVHQGWNPLPVVPGFSIHEPDGTPHRGVLIVNAAVERGHPSVISLLLNTNDPGPVSVAYGLGHHPHCALVDMRDMPLPAFLPIPL